MTTKMNAKRPTNNAELIAVSLKSNSAWTVLSALLMREYGMQPMQARIKAAKILKGQSRDAAEIAFGDVAKTIAAANA